MKENFNDRRTCREGKLYLLINDLHGDEVMFLIEAAVVEQQTIRLFGRKSGGEKTKAKRQERAFIDFIHMNKRIDSVVIVEK